MEGKHHLLDPAGFTLDGPRGPLFDPLLRLLLCLRGVVGHGIYSSKVMILSRSGRLRNDFSECSQMWSGVAKTIKLTL